MLQSELRFIKRTLALPRKLDVELKGGMYTFMSLKLYTGDIDTIDQRIADKVLQAPGFFKDTPVVVDFTDLDAADNSLDTAAILERIKAHHLVPIVASVVDKSGEVAQQLTLPLIEGVARRSKTSAENDSAKQNDESSDAANRSNTDASLTNSGSSNENAGGESAKEDSDDNSDDNVEAAAGAVDSPDVELDAELEPLSAQEVQYIVKQPQLLRRPVRSGQQVYARDTDLIIMGQVGPGAEVIADNHIHVYGPLRGRALCGVSGNTEARIFCQSLEAELVSVAGNYRVLESIPEDLRGKPAQIWLDDERLNIEPL